MRVSWMVQRRLVTTAVLGVGAVLLGTALASVVTLLGAQSGSPVGLPSLDARSATERSLERVEAGLQRRPGDSRLLLQLGQLSLQRARETGDPSWYARAEQALQQAGATLPRDAELLVAEGELALVRHDFASALTLGEQAQALRPQLPAAHAVTVDALVELGRYDEAARSTQRLIDLRPDLPSWSRVSYLRELQGDTAGAIEAMETAARIGETTPGGAWARVQLGNLLLNSGDVNRAERAYRQALSQNPREHLASAGLGRVAFARGDLGTAIDRYERVAERLPLPEVVVTLGELYEAAGRQADASRQFALVRQLQALAAANGADTDLELALFEADRGDPQRALELARAQAERRDSIHTADALAWAAYRAGDLALAASASDRALRTGSRDPLLLYHAGRIQLALGNREAGLALLRAALVNPAFSVAKSREARTLIADMEPTR